MSLQWHLRLEFVTGSQPELYDLTTNSDGNFLHFHGLPSVPVDSFDCMIPLKVFGIRTGLRKGKSFQYEIQ